MEAVPIPIPSEKHVDFTQILFLLQWTDESFVSDHLKINISRTDTPGLDYRRTRGD